MCYKEILQTSGNSLPTRLQVIIQPGGRWQTPRLPCHLNPSSTSDNLLHARGLMLGSPPRAEPPARARLEMVKVLVPVCKGTRGACYTKR
jgi:hypothetical protein